MEDIHNMAIPDTTDYKTLDERVAAELSDHKRFVPMQQRQDTGVLTTDVITSISHGKYMTFWRGVSIMKDPLDLTIIQQLLWDVKPPTVIEFGAYKGGSALWIADMLKIFGCQSRVISIDIDLSILDVTAKESPHVEFIEGDLFQVEKFFPEELLKNLAHPWLLFEDSHVNMYGVLEYFDKFTEPGDYMCIEDTNPLTPKISGQGLVKDLGYDCIGPLKLNHLKKFIMSRPERYLVDQRYTDMFGYNGTWNVNGYLKRV